jgi:type 2 lantibiotic biosynthesis protein LanM
LDVFFERLIVRAGTIDELLSDAFEALPGQKGDADVSARRLAAWCRSCASGDWSMFSRRLERDGLSIGHVLERFATVRRKASASNPAWIDDAVWIEAALQSPAKDVNAIAVPSRDEPFAFEKLLEPVIEEAEARLWAGINARAFDNLNSSAHASLRNSLLKELCGLCAPALYERFVKARKAGAAPADGEPQRDAGMSLYDRFVADMKSGGFRRLFDEKPVLLRLIATITRQWIDTSREFVTRLDTDLAAIGRDILHADYHGRVAKIEGDLSDPHNGGHSVHIVRFEDGARVVYKPKDLRLDAAWYSLVERLNRADPPLTLKAVRSIVRDGYGWTEFVEHAGCVDQDGFKRFFRRAGGWLALFHCFAGSDMHQENMIAAADHPVPIDLEMILQATSEEQKAHDVEGEAFEAAMEIVANSVMMVGLLPAYGRSPDNNLFAVGGMAGDWNSKAVLEWTNINSDTMRPAKTKEVGDTVPNLPHIDGRSAKFGDYVDDLISGFAGYAAFLLRLTRDAQQKDLFDDFAGLPVRKVIRPTRFYYILLQRLRNHRTMDDGVAWSAQADFMARLADWDRDSDLLWPLQQAERSALVALNVPHFVSPSDGDEISDAAGVSIRTDATSGWDRAKARMKSLDEQEIDWQVDVIRQNTAVVSTSLGRTSMSAAPEQLLPSDTTVAPTRETFIAETGKIAEEVAIHAVRRGPGAAWIGLDWMGDSEVSQLVTLGPDLYNGVSGIALFLAAHVAVTGSESSRELALAGLAYLRKSLKGKTSARMARSLGTGGASGLGSVVYALTVMAKLLRDDELLADAHVAAKLFTDDLIAADKQLDIMGGSAGGILGLLRLNRDSPSRDVLKRAIKCGEHLLAQPRVGPAGLASWKGDGLGSHALNGMSHGAAGFAYALASLSSATGRGDFAKAAEECIVFENSSFNAEHNNWPDFRTAEDPGWLCQWCHGATGIGLARIASTKRGGLDSKLMTTDIERAVQGVERGWGKSVDTLCCGTLGNVEFLCEAGSALGRPDLRDLASRRLMTILKTAASAGDYEWSGGKRRFNLGLFRGLAGVGYTFLRQVDGTLPNVLIWE